VAKFPLHLPQKDVVVGYGMPWYVNSSILLSLGEYRFGCWFQQAKWGGGKEKELTTPFPCPSQVKILSSKDPEIPNFVRRRIIVRARSLSFMPTMPE
jgi:hypothetical protein